MMLGKGGYQSVALIRLDYFHQYLVTINGVLEEGSREESRRKLRPV